MRTARTALRRIAAGSGALALALAGAIGAGTAASAAEVGPDQPDAPDYGTLTINKFIGEPLEPGQTPSDGDLLDGVEFTVTQVGRDVGGTCTPIDLTNAEDWGGLENLFNTAPAAPTDPYCLTTTTQVGTTGDTLPGTVAFTLDVGIYFVEETDSPVDVVSSVPSFYVSIPTPSEDEGGGWNYNVVAHPKNQVMDAPSKTITERPDALVIGSNVTWTMDVPVPTLNNSETFYEAIITDTLDSRLAYVPGSTVIDVNGTALEDGVHYNVTGNAVFTLTEAGLAVLDANMGTDMTITFKTEVLSVGDGDIPNSDYWSSFNGGKLPGTDVPFTYWGQLKVMKVDNSEMPLAGAEFQVFEQVGDMCPADAPASGQIATGTSDVDGVVQWDVSDSSDLGLWVANSNTELPDPTKDYCLYETVVPAGHTAVDVDNPVTISPGVDSLTTLTVVNYEASVPDLPLTGAQGTMLLTLGGLVLVGTGGGALALSRRRNNA